MKIKPIVKVPLKYGFFGGILVVIAIIVMNFFEGNPIVNSRILDFFILPLFTFFSIKEYRDYYNAKELHFWHGIIIGYINVFTIAIISSLFIYIFISFIDQETLITYVTARVNEMINNKENLKETMGEEVYQSTLSNVKNITAFDVALDDLIKKSLIGLFVTIIISVILRRVPTF